MPHERFNHSYQHCRGVGCERSADCISHLALEEAERLGLKNYLVIDSCQGGELYLRVRIEKGGEG